MKIQRMVPTLSPDAADAAHEAVHPREVFGMDQRCETVVSVARLSPSTCSSVKASILSRNSSRIDASTSRRVPAMQT